MSREWKKDGAAGVLRALAGVWCVGLLALLPGCPRTGAVCGEGQVACGQGCVDVTSDARHCGACGNACGERQLCQGSACACQPGTNACASGCADLLTDAQNCGICGNACAAGEVCESGGCQVSCTTQGTSRCGRSCVNLQTDPAHCGLCDNACPDVQTCRAGGCGYDVVAACFNSGQLRGVQAGADLVGPLVASAPNPQALARVDRHVLLVGDALAREIYQANTRSLALYPPRTASGSDVRHILVEDPYAYVVEDGTHTLQVLRREGTAQGGGYRYVVVNQVNLGANSYPQAIARVGAELFIPLFGGFGSQGEAVGQKVVRVNVTDPANPVVGEPIDLSGVDLKPFAGGRSIPRPSWILSRNGKLYVPLNNLRSDYSPGGPGLLARIDPATREVTAIDLGEGCLNAGYVGAAGDRLLVSCGGQTDYSVSPPRVAKTGVVLLGADDQRASFASLECPAGQAGCASASAYHLAVAGDRVYVGDATQGRLFVLELVNGQLVERRGFHGASEGGQPIAACPPGPFGGLVSDIIALP